MRLYCQKFKIYHNQLRGPIFVIFEQIRDFRGWYKKNRENTTYTELQNLDFIEDATETLRPCLGNGSVWGGFSIGKFESPISGAVEGVTQNFSWAVFITFELLILKMYSQDFTKN